VEVREATEQDVTELSGMLAEFRIEHSRMIGGTAEYKLEYALEDVRKHFAQDGAGYFVVEDDSGRLLGFRRWELSDGFYFTREMYVVPDARGRGVAKALIRHFEHQLREKGQDVACISCTPHNVAMIELARAEGYTILNTIEMRKNLVGDMKTRGEARALEWRWDIL
jgi:ribosomal protein S18 acetylase RimI-like enzyme